MKNFSKPYKPARISKGEKEWFIYYHYQYPAGHPNHPKWKQFKDRGGLNYKDMKENVSERKAFAEALRDAYNDRLKGGWSPFGLDENVAEQYDDLKYMPLLKVFERFNKMKEKSLKRRTWQSYNYSLNVLRKWMKKNNMEHYLLETFKDKHAMAFVDSMREEGKLANKSINDHVSSLSVFFNAAIDRELITKNPFKKVQKLPEQTGKNYALSEKQKQQLKKIILEHRPELWMFVKGIYHLFVRPLELLQVRIADIDLRTKQIIIHSAVGKNKKQLPVEIPKSFIAEIKALKLDKLPADWYWFGKGYKPGPHKMKRNTVSEHHGEMLDIAKLDRKKYSLYGWKHTGNVDSYLAGVDIYDLMRQNRHHSIAQTEQYLQSLGLRPNINYSNKAPKL